MKNFRQAKITSIVCILAVLLISAVDTAAKPVEYVRISDRTGSGWHYVPASSTNKPNSPSPNVFSTSESEVFISPTQFIVMNLVILQMAYFVLLIRAVVIEGAGAY